MTQPFVIRADASIQMGTGHVMRGLALAQAWQDRGGRAVFAAAELPQAFRERLLAENCRVDSVEAVPGESADAHATADLAADVGAEWIVLDGYRFDGDFQQRLKDRGFKVLAVDDYGHAGRYPADLVLNQNLGADAALYADRGPGTRLLLGTRYALLRREFAAYRTWERAIPEVGRKVLVTLGGSDPDNVTLKVIRALGKVDVAGLEAIVVVGGGNPHVLELEAAARDCPARIEVRTNVSDMPGLMAWADAAVAAGGTTSWERALLGLPNLILVLAENQLPIAQACQNSGLGCNLGWSHAVSEGELAAGLTRLLPDRSARLEMFQRGRTLVDGLGGERVVTAMRGRSVCLRPVQADDARLIWEWANDPVTRQWSFVPDPIPWEDHLRWFSGRIADPQCEFLLAEDRGLPVGQIRFEADADGRVAVVSISLAPEFRGKGYGTAALSEACRVVLAARPLHSVLALIRPGNEPSVRTFESAGFLADGGQTVRGLPALRYKLIRCTTSE